MPLPLRTLRALLRAATLTVSCAMPLLSGCGGTQARSSSCRDTERPTCLTPVVCSTDAQGCERCECGPPAYTPPAADTFSGPPPS